MSRWKLPSATGEVQPASTLAHRVFPLVRPVSPVQSNPIQSEPEMTGGREAGRGVIIAVFVVVAILVSLLPDRARAKQQHPIFFFLCNCGMSVSMLPSTFHPANGEQNNRYNNTKQLQVPGASPGNGMTIVIVKEGHLPNPVTGIRSVSQSFVTKTLEEQTIPTRLSPGQARPVPCRIGSAVTIDQVRRFCRSVVLGGVLAMPDRDYFFYNNFIIIFIYCPNTV